MQTSQAAKPPRQATGTHIQAFQPRSLADILGQGPIVAYLRKFVANPHSAAMLFEGETGVGKTSTALALAAELGCDMAAGDLGGVRVVASGEQTADAVRDAVSFLQFIPMQGSGWKVLVVNEADRMSTAAETIWLDALERLPNRSLAVFTTNHTAKLSDRFQDRCLIMHFAGDSKSLAGDAGRLLQRVWRECAGTAVPPRTERRLLKDAIRDGCLSFRRLLQLAEQELLVSRDRERGRSPLSPEPTLESGKAAFSMEVAESAGVTGSAFITRRGPPASLRNLRESVPMALAGGLGAGEHRPQLSLFTIGGR